MKFVKMFFALALVAQFAIHAEGQETTLSKQERHQLEQRRIAVQDICPISGNKLGAHGKPIKVTVGKAKEEIYLCCKGCLKKKFSAKHWVTIHANFAKAQADCPVMKKKLPKNPKWTIVSGQIVYVCCPPCTKKIQADPQKYLQKVSELYSISLKDEQTRRQ